MNRCRSTFSVPQTERLANILPPNYFLLHSWIQKQERVPYRGDFKLQGWTKTEENNSTELSEMI